MWICQSAGTRHPYNLQIPGTRSNLFKCTEFRKATLSRTPKLMDELLPRVYLNSSFQIKQARPRNKHHKERGNEWHFMTDIIQISIKIIKKSDRSHTSRSTINFLDINGNQMRSHLKYAQLLLQKEKQTLLKCDNIVSKSPQKFLIDPFYPKYPAS